MLFGCAQLLFEIVKFWGFCCLKKIGEGLSINKTGIIK